MKKHFKLYKAGKLWLTAAIVAFGVGTVTVTANASDELSTSDTNTTEQVSDASTGNSTTSQLPDSVNDYNRQDNNTYQNTKGQTANNWQTQGNDWYHFNNGSINTGWNSIDNNWYYMNQDSAKMETGLQKINNNTYYLNDQHDGTYGAMKTGWQNVNNNWYYFQNSGAATTGWYKSAAGLWYYFNQDGAAQTGWFKSPTSGFNYYFDPANAWALTSWQRLDNSWFYFDPTNAWSDSGWLHTPADNWYYLSDKGQVQTGWYQVNNHWYYGDPSNGNTLRGWQLLKDGWHYFDTVQTWTDLGWQNIGNNWYFFDTNNHGLMLTGFHKINGQTYFLNESHDGNFGAMKTGWQWINNGWYYFQSNEAQSLGWQNVNGNTYYLDPSSGKMVTGNNLIDGNRYYFDPSSGHQIKGLFLDSNGLLVYYDNQTGAQKDSLGSFTFNPTTGEIVTSNLNNGLNVINDDTYYFDKNSNKFVYNDWRLVNNHWYHFSNNGSVHTGWYQSAIGAWYYLNHDGAAQTGWYQSAVGAWYYFDLANAYAKTGWQYINNYWYYFDPSNAYAYVGYHVINGVEYFFDLKNAYMYQNHWVNVNGWTYHADNSGRLWFPQWYSQFSSPYAAEGCSVFATAIMLSPKEYINIPYALSLLQQRQAGNIYSGAGFSVVIQPNSLVDLARHFDGSVTNISGSSVQDIINTVNSGRPVLYYGYSRYENLYWNHNHCKVIVGYQNGWFRVYDCCYNYASQGSTGWNAYDYGAKGWITTSQFTREYAGQAITVN